MACIGKSHLVMSDCDILIYYILHREVTVFLKSGLV